MEINNKNIEEVVESAKEKIQHTPKLDTLGCVFCGGIPYALMVTDGADYQVCKECYDKGNELNT